MIKVPGIRLEQHVSLPEERWNPTYSLQRAEVHAAVSELLAIRIAAREFVWRTRSGLPRVGGAIEARQKLMKLLEETA